MNIHNYLICCLVLPQQVNKQNKIFIHSTVLIIKIVWILLIAAVKEYAQEEHYAIWEPNKIMIIADIPMNVSQSVVSKDNVHYSKLVYCNCKKQKNHAKRIQSAKQRDLLNEDAVAKVFVLLLKHVSAKKKKVIIVIQQMNVFYVHVLIISVTKRQKKKKYINKIHKEAEQLSELFYLSY